MKFMHHSNNLERVGDVQKTIPEALRKKSKARVTKHDDQSKEHHEGANLMSLRDSLSRSVQ